MSKTVHGPADFRDFACSSGGSFVVHHHHSFILVLSVIRQTCFDVRNHRACPPSARQIIDVNSKSLSNLPPQAREMSGLKHQHPVARREGIDDGRFPCSGSRSWIHDDRAAGLHNFPDALQRFFHDGSKFRSAVIHDRPIDRS